MPNHKQCNTNNVLRPRLFHDPLDTSKQPLGQV